MKDCKNFITAYENNYFEYNMDFEKVSYISQNNPYYGSYSVNPKTNSDIILQTKNLIMTENLIVKKIPYYQVENVSKGDTVYIGSEVI